MTHHSRRCLTALAALLACLAIIRPGHADDGLLEDLSARRANPLSGLRSVSLGQQRNVNYLGVGRTGSQDVSTLSVVWPFALTPSWELITYTVGALVSQPGSEPEQGRVVGLGDTTVNAVVTPRRTDALSWAAGPLLQIPTATDGDLGSDRWAAGPSLALFVQPLPWTVGALLENAWSFAGSGGQDVNQFSAQYWINYNLPRGWFLQSNATATADWEAPLASRWTVPLAGGFGKVLRLAGQSMSAGAQVLYNVKEPAAEARWGFSLQLQLLLP